MGLNLMIARSLQIVLGQRCMITKAIRVARDTDQERNAGSHRDRSFDL